jgi:hypothetical protein
MRAESHIPGFASFNMYVMRWPHVKGNPAMRFQSKSPSPQSGIEYRVPHCSQSAANSAAILSLALALSRAAAYSQLSPGMLSWRLFKAARKSNLRLGDSTQGRRVDMESGKVSKMTTNREAALASRIFGSDCWYCMSIFASWSNSGPCCAWLQDICCSHPSNESGSLQTQGQE